MNIFSRFNILLPPECAHDPSFPNIFYEGPNIEDQHMKILTVYIYIYIYTV